MDVQVAAYGPGGDWISGTTADAGGGYSYILPGLPTGSVRLFFNPAGSSYRGEWYDGALDGGDVADAMSRLPLTVTGGGRDVGAIRPAF